jgi:hypothetical protein
MIWLRVEYLLEEQASGWKLSLLLQELCPCKLLGRPRPGGIRHRAFS